jgi:hypothetical protein
MLGAKVALEAAVGNVKVDAVVGRQAQALLELLADPPCSREAPTKVVLHLGTNGFVAERQLIAILDKLEDCRLVVLINAHAPRRWVDANNDLFIRVSKRYENVVLMDWHTISDGHREYFVGDDIHLTGSGLRAYSTAVASVGHFAPPDKSRPAAPPRLEPDVAAPGPVEAYAVSPESAAPAATEIPEQIPEASKPSAPSAVPVDSLDQRLPETTPASRPSEPSAPLENPSNGQPPPNAY